MTINQKLLRLALTLCLLLAGREVFAASTGCAAGFQDATCLTPIGHAVEQAPTCPGTAGWTALAPAQWTGSGYSAPQCNFTAAPTCPSGDTEQSAPIWNGSQWVGLLCVPTVNRCPFGCASDGNPYPALVGYCAESSQTTILHVVHYTFSCTSSMAGMARVNQAGTLNNGNGTLDYWNTPGSTSRTVTTATDGLFANAPGPAGTVVQTVDIVFGFITWSPGDSPGAPDSTEGTTGGGSNEGWVFACPAANPTINFATVAAFGETNPTLIECQ